PTPDVETEVIAAYIDAVTRGSVEDLAKIFAEDAVLWSDGGGFARAARHPLHGAVRVAKHLVGVAPQTPEGTEVHIVRVNGEASIMGVLDGQAIGIVTFEIRDGLVTAVRASLNPHKLAHLVWE
ncbi:MAG: RNA polymerase sigma-70 factor, partial [Acidimicrobiia bacterium]